ncbi:DNA binding protein [Hirschfeldia incana]|nr:DNA binding protein [Hirschfeldia incana]
MASPRAVSEDRKSDDLEIVSVGALYSGSWDKKYWSSSRGKDRFPYPVGYKAVRTQNENTYYMEIEEGAKGPLFLVRYLDESWAGQTPDIAWGKFQKKTGLSNLKVWHGKRFTCKMNGMEFFGFKNPLVQRLLRELVTNSHGMVESNSSNRVSQIQVIDEPFMCKKTDLLSYLDMPVTRKKRSRKAEIVHQNSVVKEDHKKPRFQYSFLGGEILYSAPESSICSAKGEVEIVGLQGALPEQLHSFHATKENLSLALENPPEVKVVVPSQETIQLPDSCKTKPLSSISEELHVLQEKENKPHNDTFLNESQDMTGSNLCAPDTLDFVQDYPISSAPVMGDNKTSCEQKEELTLADMVVNEGHSAEPDTEDLTGHEIAKSMISFLLPRAIPLLKKKSVKKTPQNDMPETMFARLNRSDNSKTSQIDDASRAAVSLSRRLCSGDDENRRVVASDSVQDFTSDVPTAPDSFDESHLDVHGSEHIISSSKEAYPADLPKNPIDEKDVEIVNASPLVSALDTVKIIKPSSHDVPIAPDSFDEYHLDVLGSGHIISPSKEAYPTDLPDKPTGEEQVVIENASLSVPALDTIEIIKPSAHDVSTILEENNLDGCVKKSMLIPQCTSPTNRIITKESEELCAKGDLVQTEHHSENKEAKTTCTSCSTQGNGLVVGTTTTEASSVRKETHKVYSRKRVSTNQLWGNKSSSSESKNSCRKTGDVDSISKMSPIKTQRTLEPQKTLSTNSASDRTNPQGDGSSHVTEHYQGPELMKVDDNQFTSVFCNEACVIPQDIRPAQGFGNASTSPPSFSASKTENVQGHIGEALGIHVSELPSTKSQYKEHTSEKSISSVPEISVSSSLKLNRDVKINNEMEKTVELLGCYFHPMPVSSVSLQSVGNEIYICVLSFAAEDRVRTLFMYKISANASTKGFPSVVGHTPVILPIVDDKSGRYVNSRTLERSYFHVTPDGEHLIFTGNIKTPYCRKKEIDCPCLTCTSASFEENAVRIVEVKTGYVSLVTKLQAIDSVQCVVVCDPYYLVAVVKGGNLIVWTMNSNWRGPTEEFVILANPCISSCIVELKKIPKCPHLIIGHNGIGEFTVWDIGTRSQVSRFVSPRDRIFEFIPTSLFAWHPLHSNSTMEDHIDMILAATKLWFSKGINNKTLVPAEVKDTAIWLLVSTDPDPEVNCDSVERPGRFWRLALLVRNQVILGSPLDPRADVAGTVSGHGVTGTVDGLVYLWDMSTGLKLGSLHDFKGQGVSCISSDDSGNICIASEDGQLLVYCHPTKESQSQGV